MVVGIRVRNQFFTTQIDHNFKNYGFAQIIPVSVSVLISSVSEQGLVQVTVPGINSLVGVRCSLLSYIPLGSYFDGTNWLYTFKFFGDWTVDPTNPKVETVQFYVFNTIEIGAFSNIGIRIRHPVTGQIGFHSDMRPLYMEAKSPCTSPFSGTPGQVYCPIVTRFPFINSLFPSIGFRLQPWSLRCSGSDIAVQQQTLPAHYAAFADYYDPGEYAVINVTGLS